MPRLYVGGLHDKTTDREICDRFSSFGSVEQVEVMRTASGACKGFAYVSLNTDDSKLKKCLTTLNHAKWKGKVLRVEEAKEKYDSKLTKEWEEQKRLDEERKQKLEADRAQADKRISVWRRGKAGRWLPVLYVRRPNGRIMLLDPSKLKDNIVLLEDAVDVRQKTLDQLTWKWDQDQAPKDTPKPKKAKVHVYADEIAEELKHEKEKSLSILDTLGIAEPVGATMAATDALDAELEIKPPPGDGSDGLAAGWEADAGAEPDEAEEAQEKEDSEAQADEGVPPGHQEDEDMVEGHSTAPADDEPLEEPESTGADADVAQPQPEANTQRASKLYQVKVPSLRTLLKPDASFSLLGSLPAPDTEAPLAAEESAAPGTKKTKRKRDLQPVALPKRSQPTHEPIFFFTHVADGQSFFGEKAPGEKFWWSGTLDDAKKQWEEQRSYYTTEYKKKHKTATKRIAKVVRKAQTK